MHPVRYVAVAMRGCHSGGDPPGSIQNHGGAEELINSSDRRTAKIRTLARIERFVPPRASDYYSMNSPEHIFQILLTFHRTSGRLSQRNFYKTVYRMVDLMTSPFPLYRKGTLAICLLALLALMLVASGCTQPSSQQQQKAPAAVTVTQTDNSHIRSRFPAVPT